MIIYYNFPVSDYYDYENDGMGDDEIRQFSIVNHDVFGVDKSTDYSDTYFYDFEEQIVDHPFPAIFAAIETIIHVNDRHISIYPAYVFFDKNGELYARHTMFNLGTIYDYYY